MNCPILGFAAFSGVGKTTLLMQLIPLLRNHGLRLGLIKHSHHAAEIDRPGKDSYILHQAGAKQTLVASSRRTVLIRRHSQEPDLPDLLARLDGELDLVLVEGFKAAVLPKIELHRPSLGHPLLCRNDAAIIAVAVDAPLGKTVKVPVLDLNDPPTIANFILHRFMSGRR